MAKDRDFNLNQETMEMTVFMRSKNPSQKGVRGKAQEYLKTLGMYGAMCSIRHIEIDGKNSLVTLKVYDPVKTFKDLYNSHKRH